MYSNNDIYKKPQQQYVCGDITTTYNEIYRSSPQDISTSCNVIETTENVKDNILEDSSTDQPQKKRTKKSVQPTPSNISIGFALQGASTEITPGFSKYMNLYPDIPKEHSISSIDYTRPAFKNSPIENVYYNTNGPEITSSTSNQIGRAHV